MKATAKPRRRGLVDALASDGADRRDEATGQASSLPLPVPLVPRALALVNACGVS